MSDVAILLLSGVIGIVSALIASFIFQWLTLRRRPDIKIAPEIAKTRFEKDEVYNIKIINRTPRTVVDVKLRCMLVTHQYGSSGAPVYIRRDIPLRKAELMTLPRFDSTDPDAHYAIRMTILEDLDAIWQDDRKSHLHFQVYATHSISGFGDVFEQNFYRKSEALKTGEYAPRNSFKIS